MNGKAGILIVDDLLPVREIVQLILKERYRVNAVACAEEALRFMAENHVSLVLLDVNMPGMGGISALKEIKKRFPETEVIMMSGDATVDIVRHAIRLGALAFLSKPVDNADLVAAVEKALK